MKRTRAKYFVLSAALAAALMFTAFVPVACSCSIDAPDFVKEVLVDFADGEQTDIIFASDGWNNGGSFDVEWDPTAVTYENGVAKLSVIDADEGATKPYYGAELRTQKWYKYGYYGVCMKPSGVDGSVSTFFTYTGPYEEYDEEGNLHPWDEIDIEFVGGDTTRVQFNYYAGADPANAIGHEHWHELGFDAAEDFHEYGFLWEEERITWYVDNEPVHQVTAKKSPEGIPSYPSRIMASHWVVNENGEAWAGEYDGSETHAEYKWISCTSDPIEPITSLPGSGDPIEPPEGGLTEGEELEVTFNGDTENIFSEITTDGGTTHIEYTTAGNSYQPLSLGLTEADPIKTAAAGKNAFTIDVKNNGKTDMVVRIDVMDTAIKLSDDFKQEHADKELNLCHQNLNKYAMQDGSILAGATDTVWGGSKFTVEAGETSTLTVIYDTENFTSGTKDKSGAGANITYTATGNFDVKTVNIFFDSARNDGETYTGDADISGVNFGTFVMEEGEAPDFGDTSTPADSVEATGSFAGMVAWANAYELKPSANNTALRVVYSNIPSAWTGIGGTIGIGTNDTVTLKIANGVARDAYLKIDVGYTVENALTTTVTECTYTDGGELSGDGKNGFAIPANTTVTVTIKVTNTTEHPVTNMNILIDSLEGFGECDYTTAYGNLLFSDMTFSSSTAA
mgnify:FL=1